MRHLQRVFLSLCIACSLSTSTVFARMTLNSSKKRAASAKPTITTVRDRPEYGEEDPYFGSVVAQGFGLETVNWNPVESDSFEGGTGFGLNYEMRYRTKFGAQVAFDQVNGKTKSTSDLSQGDLTTRMVLFSALYFPITTPVFHPYFMAGGGIHMFSRQTDAADPETQFWQAFGYSYDQNFQGVLGYQFGAGVDIFPVRGRLAIGLGYTRMVARPSVENVLVYNPTGARYVWHTTADLTSNVVTGRLLYFF